MNYMIYFISFVNLSIRLVFSKIVEILLFKLFTKLSVLKRSFQNNLDSTKFHYHVVFH